MKKNLLKGAAAFCVLCNCLSGSAQQGQVQVKLNQLITDVQNAMPNASLSDDQKTKLQGDIDSIQSQFKAAQENGSRPNRNKIMSTINDMRTFVDSGAFKKDAQDSLDKEFDGLNQR